VRVGVAGLGGVVGVRGVCGKKGVLMISGEEFSLISGSGATRTTVEVEPGGVT